MSDNVPEGYKLILKKKPTCAICQMPQMREFDEAIWGRQISKKQLADELLQEPGIIFKAYELEAHAKHLKLVKIGEVTKTITERLAEESEMAKHAGDDVEALDAIIVRLRNELNKLGEMDEVVSSEYLALSRLVSDLIEKKSRILGKINDSPTVNINLLDEFKKKLEEVEKN